MAGTKYTKKVPFYIFDRILNTPPESYPFQNETLEIKLDKTIKLNQEKRNENRESIQYESTYRIIQLYYCTIQYES